MTENKDEGKKSGGGAGGDPRKLEKSENLPNVNLLRNAARVSIVTETLSIESSFR